MFRRQEDPVGYCNQFDQKNMLYIIVVLIYLSKKLTDNYLIFTDEKRI